MRAKASRCFWEYDIRSGTRRIGFLSRSGTKGPGEAERMLEGMQRRVRVGKIVTFDRFDRFDR